MQRIPRFATQNSNNGNCITSNKDCITGTCACCACILPASSALALVFGAHAAPGWGFTAWVAGTVAGGAITHSFYSCMSNWTAHTDSAQTPLIPHTPPSQMGGPSSVDYNSTQSINPKSEKEMQPKIDLKNSSVENQYNSLQLMSTQERNEALQQMTSEQRIQLEIYKQNLTSDQKV